jgi:starch synthase (maltosyl-transferring)
MMRTLAKIGFHQSYTYFTWRNDAEELTEYMLELSEETAPYMRPNFFTNTPDILNAYLQYGGLPAFKIRAVLASMLSPTWGIYSGFELGENVPIRPGSEEYLDSEKYQYRPRDWAAVAAHGWGIADYITELNRIRRDHPALHWLRNVHFHRVDQPELMCFSKRASRIPPSPVTGGAPGDDTVLVVVNVDPHQTREATVWLDLSALGVDREFIVTDELTGESYVWGRANYVRLDPQTRPAHIFTVTPRV